MKYEMSNMVLTRSARSFLIAGQLRASLKMRKSRNERSAEMAPPPVAASPEMKPGRDHASSTSESSTMIASNRLNASPQYSRGPSTESFSTISKKNATVSTKLTTSRKVAVDESIP